MKSQLTALCALALTATVAEAKVSITESNGWFESAYVKWTNDLTTYAGYNVYYKASGAADYTKLDKELVRNYQTYGRADVVGIKAGKYVMKVVPVKSDGTEDTAEAAETGELTATAHDRTGFAFSAMTEGVTSKAGVKFNAADGLGAYKLDGTLKDDARVVYVNANNAKTVSLGISDGKKEVTYTGLQQIIYGYQKGADARPLDIRIVGTIKDTDCDKFLSSAEGIQIKGANAYMPINITIEGIGDDATIWGFGFLLRSVSSVELRNFGIMLCMDDCISIDTKNEHIWVHNIDLFYGNTGGDADQAKGDGTIDLKGNSKYLTFSYNHLYDSGKASLCGMKSESGPNYITYHHNWFDHSDSRHPRIRTMSVHVYNNYFDGNAKYGVGMTMGGSAFVEANYFRNCKYPMLISKQGTDAEGDGTFSGENGGVIKAFNNTIKGAKKVTYYAKDNTNFDAYEAASRDEQVPSSVKALAGGTSYDNFDTNSSVMYSCTPDDPASVPATVMGWLGAGRMGHGDFKWQFDNKTQDENYSVIAELKAELKSYKSSIYDFYDGTVNANYGEFTGSGGDPEKHEDFTPTWSGADSSDDDDDLTIAKRWDFTKWSSESQATLTSSWEQKSDKTDRYTLTLTKDAAQSIGLAETEGITFSGSNIMVSFDSGKGCYIQGSMTFHVAVSEGDVVSVVFANTGGKNGSRDLLMNGETVASSSNTTKVTGQYTIPAGVSELTIAGSASLNFYGITIANETGSGDDDDPNATKEVQAAEVARTEYYTLGGARIAKPTRGVNIVRTVYTDGSVKSRKIMTR
ncbi:MAG: polysaccharide lyase family 1 protein [Marinilabiliaceae bacterium]